VDGVSVETSSSEMTLLPEELAARLRNATVLIECGSRLVFRSVGQVLFMQQPSQFGTLAQMRNRYLYYRWKEIRGSFDDLKEERYRSYADGTVRHLRYRTDPVGKRACEVIGSWRPSDEGWTTFFAVVYRCDAWESRISSR